MSRYNVLEFFEKNQDFFQNTVEPNIEKYRKGDVTVNVTDSNGKKIPCTVKINQIKHEFKFGANLFMLEELETEKKNQLYKEYFKKTFNMATLPFYWCSIEPERGKTRYAKDSPKFYRRPAIDLCIEFCEENGIEPREHALAYEHLFPSWLKNASVDQVKKALESRMREIAQRYKDKIPTIEVTNEMLWSSNDSVTSFYNENDYVEWCFKTAEKYFPNNQLVINEYTEASWWDNCRSTDNYYAYTQANLLKGARIDAIGMQYHMFCDKKAELERAQHLYNPISLYKHMDLYSGLVNHLQVTEITVPAYSNEKDDEEIQSKILEYLYHVWFSHPHMEQIIYWNLVDGYAYVSNPTPEEIGKSQGNMSIGENVYYGGLLRFDMSPKPAYIMLDNLINKKWHTELTASLNKDSNLRFRGFFGDYEIEIEADGKIIKKNFTLSSKGINEITITV